MDDIIKDYGNIHKKDIIWDPEIWNNAYGTGNEAQNIRKIKIRCRNI